MTTGQCSPTCFPRQTCCGDTCVDTQNDPSSCGGCGTACQAYHMCTNGSCDLCPSEPIDYVTCPVNDPGGHIAAVCCRPETPNCCFGSRGGGGCCGDDTTASRPSATDTAAPRARSAAPTATSIRVYRRARRVRESRARPGATAAPVPLTRRSGPFEMAEGAGETWRPRPASGEPIPWPPGPSRLP